MLFYLQKRRVSFADPIEKYQSPPDTPSGKRSLVASTMSECAQRLQPKRLNDPVSELTEDSEVSQMTRYNGFSCRLIEKECSILTSMLINFMISVASGLWEVEECSVF